MLERSGINIHGWLEGFSSVHECVRNSVEVIRFHPLIPSFVPVHGLIIDPFTGKLDLVIDGNTEQDFYKKAEEDMLNDSQASIGSSVSQARAKLKERFVD